MKKNKLVSIILSGAMIASMTGVAVSSTVAKENNSINKNNESKL